MIFPRFLVELLLSLSTLFFPSSDIIFFSFRDTNSSCSSVLNISFPSAFPTTSLNSPSCLYPRKPDAFWTAARPSLPAFPCLFWTLSICASTSWRISPAGVCIYSEISLKSSHLRRVYSWITCQKQLWSVSASEGASQGALYTQRSLARLQRPTLDCTS